MNNQEDQCLIFRLGNHQYRIQGGVVDVWNLMTGVWDWCPPSMAQKALEHVRHCMSEAP